MKMKKRLASLLMLTMLVSAFDLYDVGAASEKSNVRQLRAMKMQTDTMVIPDKYNTGITVDESKLTRVTLGGSAPCRINDVDSSVQFRISGQNNSFNWGASNFQAGEYVFENLNFENYLWCLNSTKVDGNVEVIFNNCKFKGFSSNNYQDMDNMSFTFNNCTFESASGSDSVYNNCYFGGGIMDRMNFYSDVEVNNCYVANPSSDYENSGEIHVDGVQIFGDNRQHLQIGNIHYKNVRFEMPACIYPNAPKTYVNACIMLQLEFSDADDITFEDCYVDGGGYAIYSRTKSDDYKISNSAFKNITFGCASRYGQIYPDKSDDVNYNTDTWKAADTAFVSTVKKTDDSILFYISNNTNQARYIKAVTSTGHEYRYVIDAMPDGKSVPQYKFEELPIDLECSIPEKCDWVVIYDVVDSVDNPGTKEYKQIRYEDWTGEDTRTVKITSDDMNWSVDNGILTIDAWGKMGDYSLVDDVPNTPWYEKRNEIKKVVIKDETENIGAYAFYGMDKLTDVVIESKLTEIGVGAFEGCSSLKDTEFLKTQNTITTINKNTFYNCYSLKDVYIPKNIHNIGLGAFGMDDTITELVVESRNLYYEGTRYEWNENVTCDRYQPNDISSNPLGATTGDMYENYKDLVTSFDGNKVEGKAIKVNAFVGCKSLKKIENIEKCTSVGFNAFRNSGLSGDIIIKDSKNSVLEKLARYCFEDTEIESIAIPRTVKEMELGIFLGCKSLKAVYIPKDVQTMKNLFCDAHNHNVNQEINIYTDADTENIPAGWAINWNQKNFDYKLNNQPISGELANTFYLVQMPYDLTEEPKKEPDNGTEEGDKKESEKEPDNKEEPKKESEKGAQSRDGHVHNYELKIENISGPATFNTDKTCERVVKCKECGVEQSRERVVVAPGIGNISITKSICTYTGKQIKPSVVIKDVNGNSIADTNYSIIYKNNKKIGKAKVIVSFKNNYAGKKELSFSIGPKGITLLKAKAYKKSLYLTWKKQKINTDGYQIQYSTDKAFKKNVRSVYISKTNNNSIVISKVKSRNKYYVRGRSFKKIKKKKYYSQWSKTKKVKVKF